MDHDPTERRPVTVTDPRLLRNALDHQFRGFRGFWFDRIAPAGPVLLPAARGAELEGAAVRLARLLRRAAWSLGGDCLARHRALGLDERLTDFYTDEETEWRYATAIGRPDLVLTGSGWKFVEFNFCSATGGQVFFHLLNDLWRQLPPGRVPGLALGDPLTARNAWLHTVLAENGLEPRLALVGHLPDVGVGSRRYYEIEVDALRKAGIEAEYFGAGRFADGADTLGGGFPLVLERMVPQEWLDAGRSLAPLLGIRKCGPLVLTPQSSYQAANKQLFAVLSSGQDWMTDQDRELVRTYLPWTRSIRQEQVEYQGERWKLTDLLVSRRADFVLKRSDGDQRADVHLGFRTSASAWEAVVAKGLRAGTWIAQEAVHSVGIGAEVLDCERDEYRTIATRAVFGPLIIGGRMAGCGARYEVPDPGEGDDAPRPGGPTVLGTVGWYPA